MEGHAGAARLNAIGSTIPAAVDAVGSQRFSCGLGRRRPGRAPSVDTDRTYGHILFRVGAVAARGRYFPGRSGSTEIGVECGKSLA